MIKVRAIGTAEVQIGRKRITKSTELVLAVAVYLSMRAGERVTRDAVIDVFWPDGDPMKGRHSLRQMLYKLRLRGFTLDEDAEALYIDPARVDCDATAALAESWPETVEPWMIEDSGEFLPVVTREISPQFQAWMDETRSRLATQYRLAALRQIVQARREGRWADLERWARVALRTDPLNEEATLARAESAAMAGSKATALEILDQYVEDLGERAGQIALPATVLRRRISERRPEWGGRGVREVGLVGREQLMNRLTESIEAAATGLGGAFVMRGAAGIGKTRLGNEARAYAEFGGFRSIVIRVPRTSSTQPLFVALGLIPQLLELRGAAGCPPLAMALLRSATVPERMESIHSPATTSPDALTWALGALLEAISVELKLCIQLDDLHHCDSESLRLIGQLAATTGSLRLVWFATTRLSHSAEGNSLPHTPGFLEISVPPLSRESSVSLARAYSHTHPRSRSDSDLHQIAALSGGNPLFLRELSARTEVLVDATHTPASLRRLIWERLSELSSYEVLILRVVGILGSHAAIFMVRSITRGDNTAFADALEVLSHSGIVSMGIDGTLELHESWQVAVFEQLTPAACAALGLECAELLAAEGVTSGSLSRTRRAAELFLESGDVTRASQLFEQSGDELRARRLLGEAADAYERSIAAIGADSAGGPLFVKLAGVEHAALDFDATLSICDRALRNRSRLSHFDSNSQTHLEALEVDALWKSGRDYRRRLEQLASAVRRSDLSAEACHFASLIGIRLLMNDGFSHLEEQFVEALTSSTSLHGPSLFGQLALLVYHAERGTAQDVLALERSFALTPVADLAPSLQCLSLRYRSNALRWIGKFDEALSHGRDAVARAIDLGLLGEIDFAATQLSFMSMDRCDLKSASTWLDTGRQAHKGVSVHERTRAHMHAAGRLLYQSGEFSRCLQVYSEMGFDPLSDTLTKRGAVVGATVAAAAAQTGQVELASRLLRHCVEVIGRESPSLVLDYVTELSTRALKSLRRNAEASALIDSYLQNRSTRFDRPLAAFYRELAHAQSASA